MNNKNNDIAILESRIDHLETELSYLDNLLVRCGFPEGIATLKLTAEELLSETASSSSSSSSEGF